MFETTTHIKGVMLVELMLSLTLGLLIVSSVSAIYTITEKNHQKQVALNNLLETARSAINILKYDIQYAGYAGCMQNNSRLIKSLDLGDAITGTDTTITIFHAKSDANILRRATHDARSLHLNLTPRFQTGQWVMISDCEKAEIFPVSMREEYGSMQMIYPPHRLKHDYDVNAEVTRFYHNTYSIRRRGKKTTQGIPVSSLYVEHISHWHHEMIPGIDEMSFLYDVAGKGLKPAIQITSWPSVKGVLVKLVITSTQGEPMRRIWYTYIALRET